MIVRTCRIDGNQRYSWIRVKMIAASRVDTIYRLGLVRTGMSDILCKRPL
jgi:hypothetical protein